MKVSVAIVAYNEEKTLPKLLEDLSAQDYPHEKIEVLLIDSMSDDKTYEIMKEFSKETDFCAVKLLKNEKKTLPFGCNIMLDNYTGDAIVRLDAHASVPAHFISKNVAVIKSGEFVSGGRRPNIIDENTNWKETLLISEQSMFGSGIATYRNSDKKRYVSSVFHGMYRREVYDTVGFYNVNLARTEDNDMSHRIQKAGYKICYCPDIISYQHTRNNLKSMLRQKYLNGYWIGKTMGINPHCFSLFHFVPFCFVLGIIFTTFLAAFGMPFLAILMWALYGALVLAISLMEIMKKPVATNLLLPLLFLLLHISYGVGTLVGLIKMPFWLKKIKK